MRILTLDIGGAYTKKLISEDGQTRSSSEYFPLWKRKEEFSKSLSKIGKGWDVVGVTMTAELCDVFNSKDEGVKFIVECCSEAFEDPYFLSVTPRLVKKEDISDFNFLSGANWTASLHLMRKKFGSGLLFDMGSTTTDILPFGPDSIQFKSDFERLKARQLVYNGLLRTPVNSIVSLSNDSHRIGVFRNNGRRLQHTFGCGVQLRNTRWKG
jgi:probable H4MPT-linked C1 transfer pathway protein